MHRSNFRRGLAAAAAVVVVSAGTAPAQQVTGFGVTGNGVLFRFDTATPNAVTTIGNLGIVPEAIDFRPLSAAQIASGDTPTLYAIDVGPTTTQLYTVNTQTAAVTPVGSGFPSFFVNGASYDLRNQGIGFDFNPTTLQGDGSIRIRVTASGGSNMRLNSNTGGIAAIDTPLQYAAGDPNTGAPSVDGSAYINSNVAVPAGGGTTTLYGIDFRTDDLVTQVPPNAGTLNTVNAAGLGVDADSGIGFDVFTDPGSTDSTIGGDRAFAVMRTAGSQLYQLYDINLATGAATNPRAVGGGLDFGGGFAVVPEPAAAALLMIPVAALLRRRRG